MDQRGERAGELEPILSVCLNVCFLFLPCSSSGPSFREFCAVLDDSDGVEQSGRASEQASEFGNSEQLNSPSDPPSLPPRCSGGLVPRKLSECGSAAVVVAGGIAKSVERGSNVLRCSGSKMDGDGDETMRARDGSGGVTSGRRLMLAAPLSDVVLRVCPPSTPRCRPPSFFPVALCDREAVGNAVNKTEISKLPTKLGE